MASPDPLISYVDGFRHGTVAAVDWAEDVSFHGPLLPAPIEGRSAVIAFLERIVTSIETVELRRVSRADDGGCLELAFRFAGVAEATDEVHALRVRDGRIEQVTLYYDPRPLL
ncbi:MAG: nuclear transport factor 2 family protein [Actinomycetota bacterium]